MCQLFKAKMNNEIYSDFTVFIFNNIIFYSKYYNKSYSLIF